MPIRPFAGDCVFDPEQIAAMSRAFESLCRELALPDRNGAIAEMVARHIVNAAKRGMRSKTALYLDAKVEFMSHSQRGHRLRHRSSDLGLAPQIWTQGPSSLAPCSPQRRAYNIGRGHGVAWEPAMSLSDRVTISFVALAACSILWTMALSAPSFGQPRVEAGADNAHPHAPVSNGRRHVRGTYIVCETSDVHSCHREFRRRHRAKGH